MTEPIHAYLIRRLRENVGAHQRISAETGIPQSTISGIFSTTGRSPRLSTVQPLLDWFEKHDRVTGKPKRRAGVKAGRPDVSAASELGDEPKGQHSESATLS